MIKQKTIKSSVYASGIGLHTGKKVNLTLSPAPFNTGIVFRRILGGQKIDVAAKLENVVSTKLAITLGNKSVAIATVEHLLSAIAGLGIDNLYIELDADEVPIMDGSAAPFVFLLQSGGIVEQEAAKKFIRIKKPVSINAQGKTAELIPHSGFKISFEVDYKHKLQKLARQTISLDFAMTSYLKEISRARTYGFKKDYKRLVANSLALGGNLDNAIFIDEHNVVNEGGLRYSDELVRHKILDAVGDLFLLGYNLVGEFKAYKSNHSINTLLLTKLLRNPDNYEVLSYSSLDSAVSYNVAASTFSLIS